MDYKRMNEFRLLGLTIAYYRKLRGMTQADLAEATQLSRTHISNIEAPNGKTSISLNKLFDIALYRQAFSLCRAAAELLQAYREFPRKRPRT